MERIYKPVKALRDGSGHWYIVPNEMLREFLSDQENEIDDFDSKYAKFRTGGDLNLIQLYVQTKDKK